MDPSSDSRMAQLVLEAPEPGTGPAAGLRARLRTYSAGLLSPLPRGRTGQRPARLRPADLVLVGYGALAMLVLTGPASHLPGALRSGAFFGATAVGLLLVRAAEARWARQRWLGVVGDFWMLPVASFGHGQMGPLADFLHPGRLYDGWLARADLELFGGHASAALAGLPPWGMDVLMVCYYLHFVWALALGLVLWQRGRRADFDEYLGALSLVILTTYGLYAVVPAVGPRFFLLDAFSGPLQGTAVTGVLDAVMRTPAFVRDCFPSGHTGVTLVVAIYAARFAPRFFAVAVLPLAGLVVATIAGRFHYVTDLLVALPLAAACVAAAVTARRAERRVAAGWGYARARAPLLRQRRADRRQAPRTV